MGVSRGCAISLDRARIESRTRRRFEFLPAEWFFARNARLVSRETHEPRTNLFIGRLDYNPSIYEPWKTIFRYRYGWETRFLVSFLVSFRPPPLASSLRLSHARTHDRDRSFSIVCLADTINVVVVVACRVIHRQHESIARGIVVTLR